MAPGHHRFTWRHVTAFVAPASGETVWYLVIGMSEPFVGRLLADFIISRTSFALPNRLPKPSMERISWKPYDLRR